MAGIWLRAIYWPANGAYPHGNCEHQRWHTGRILRRRTLLSILIGVLVAWFNDTDLVVRKFMMHLGHFQLRHVACDTIFRRHRTRMDGNLICGGATFRFSARRVAA